MKNKDLTTYLLLAALVVGAAYFAYFKPKQASLKTIRNERIAAEQQVDVLRAKKRQLDKIEAELVTLSASLSELETIIPQKKETSDILRNIQQMASDQQLDLKRWTQNQETVRDFYTEWPIPIVVEGTFNNLALFFDRILHFPRIFNIEDFSIIALPNQMAGNTITASFTLKSYFFLEQALIKKPPQKKPAASARSDRDEI
ncbi:MAG: type 4a pilus biogenesis protein PilO [Candidatus Aminicenantes bacterium]|nr:type 4a pilus biogenesis protein PilO [Candidatus Aminicenantes bacterium]